MSHYSRPNSFLTTRHRYPNIENPYAGSAIPGYHPNSWPANGGAGIPDGSYAADYDYTPAQPPYAGEGITGPGGSYDYYAQQGIANPTYENGSAKFSQRGRGKKGAKDDIGDNGKKSNSTALSALTLLSFFFFMNLLQNCIKEHMDAMNPTVVVMTPNVLRKSSNKMDEINFREDSPHTSENKGFQSERGAEEVTSAAALPQGKVTLKLTTRNAEKYDPYGNTSVTHYEKPTYTMQTTYIIPDYEPQRHHYSYEQLLLYPNETLITRKPTYDLSPDYSPLNNHAYSGRPSLTSNAYPQNKDSAYYASSGSNDSIMLGPYRRASIVAIQTHKNKL